MLFLYCFICVIYLYRSYCVLINTIIIITGYRSLNGLRMRASSDKVATAFLKKLAARIPDVGKRNILRPSSAGDDGDKMSKSPSILDKIIKR